MSYKQGRCRSCGAPIIWAKTAKGKSMPIDAEPTTVGNVELTPNGTQPPTATVHTQPPLGVGELYMPHHATCPDAAEWRGR